jgi:hypothetical protein
VKSLGGKRKNLTKKLRFEVFKRDSFKCQYCGSSSPDVLLEVDHIKPVSDGGLNELTNLITSCFDCNRGKGKTLLDDNSMLEKQRKQLEELNERRNQLEMMMKWREGLSDIEGDKVNHIVSKWEELTNSSLTESGIRNVRKMVKKFDFNLILDCVEISTSQYLKPHREEPYKFTDESLEKAFSYIPKICSVKTKNEKEPEYMKDIYYIHGILRNRLAYYDKVQSIRWLVDAYEKGASLESLKEVALTTKHWTSYRRTMEAFLDE